MTTYNQSNATIVLFSGTDDTVNGNDDTISADDNVTLTANGFSNIINQSNGAVTLNGAGPRYDTVNGSTLTVNLAANSALHLNGSINIVNMGADCLVYDVGDNTNFFGSDERIHTSGATVGGVSVTGAYDRSFVAAGSQLQQYGNDDFIEADDNSSMYIEGGTNERVVGTGYYLEGLAGSESWIGGNGASGAYDTFTGSNISAVVGANSNVILHGDDDTATVRLDSNAYLVGTGFTAHVGNGASIITNANGAGEAGAVDTFTGGVFSLEVAFPATTVADTYEANITLAANSALTVEKSGNTVHAGNSDSISILSGVSNEVLLAQDDVVTDGGSRTDIQVSGNVGATIVDNFAHLGIIDLLNGVGGYTSADEAFASLTSDGAGGQTLSLGANGSIDFVGASSLSAASFKIG